MNLKKLMNDHIKEAVRFSQYWGHPITVYNNMRVPFSQLSAKQNKDYPEHLRVFEYALVKRKSIVCHQRQWEDKALSDRGGCYVALKECQSCEHHKEGCCVLDQERLIEFKKAIAARNNSAIASQQP